MINTVELSDAKRLLLQKMLSGGSAPRVAQVETVLPRPAGKRPPISLEQRNVWLHAAMAPELPLYNEAITIHRKGPFDLAVMEKSFNEILRRHEAWRTSFETVDGEVVQVVHQNLYVQLPLVDLIGVPAISREAEALRIATEEARKPFDLSVAPLFRAQIVKLAEDDHRLYLTLHHIIFDGVSIYKTIVPELAAIYDAFARGEQPSLPEPKLQYGDYALWRERNAESEAVTRQLDYWRDALAGELPVLQLPSDHPRPPALSYRGSMETFSLSSELTEALKELSRREGVTFYMTLLAAFKALLYRYTGQEDILVGGVTDTRRRPELQNLVGYFLNSIALRTRPSGDLRFRDFMRQTRDAVVGALGASDVPFDRIVCALQPKREMSAHPLFQVLFSIEPPAPSFASGWDLTQMDVTMGAAKFDLYLELDERPEGVIGRIIYSTDLFEAPTIRRMISHWRTLLESVAAVPDCTLDRLPLLTPEESRQLLVEWNDTQQDYPQTTLHEWFEAQVQKTPDAVAVEFETSSWTYEELDRRASHMAARLREAGVGRETLVAICLERSLDMIAGLLAVLKAGGAYLPLDPAFPRQRLALILDDAGPAVVLTQRSLAATLPPSNARIVIIDDVADKGSASSPPDAETSTDDLAYVIYTSGSTGKPKGVEVSHRAVVNLLASMQRQPGFGATDKLLAVTTLSFDIAALELFLPLVTGGRVILASRETATDPSHLMELIRRSGCTVMQATPATWRGLIDAGWTGNENMKILCGGEALSRDLADKLLTRCASLWNMYGPTETTIWSSVHEVTRGSGPVPIGRPIANTQIYILDARGDPVPAGVSGELYIGGAGVARGYRNRPELTAERFVQSGLAPRQRLYRTGDLARYQADGVIECLGRTDNQVKIRGFRVEVEEIEAALQRHATIAAVAVKAWQDSSGERSLTAYVVGRTGPAPGAAELREFLRQSLPDYMVPSRYVSLPALPLTPNRKIDRNALPEAKSFMPQVAFIKPRGEDERKLAEIWREVLGVRAVSSHDNFFDLGGHSLLVAKLLHRIETEFGRRLPMNVVFQAPRLDAMAALLSKPPSVKASPGIIEIQPKGSRPPLFWLNDAFMLRPLAEAIGFEQPFLGVALDPAEERMLNHFSRLAGIAANLVHAIQATQPRGPYYIGGWCTSGILAFEVASQLMKAGHEVGLVVLLHAANPVHFRRIGSLALELSRLKFHWTEMLRRRGSDRWSYLAQHARNFLRRLSIGRRLPEAVSQLSAFNGILDQAALRYEPRSYAGDVVLFQPSRRPHVLDYRAGWADVVTGEFDAHDIPGTHYTMLEQPEVMVLGAKIRDCLHRAQGQAHQAQKAAG
jgi:amino acid adenylation domain-containing protein